MLTAALHATTSRAGAKASYRVDPRPLRPDSTVFELREDGFLPLPEDVLRQRTRAIVAAGLQVGNAPQLGNPVNCAGALVPADESGVDRKAGCPRRQLNVLGIGLPRSGPSSNDFVVRAIHTTVGPSGRSSLVQDLVYRKVKGSWSLITTRGVLWAE